MLDGSRECWPIVTAIWRFPELTPVVDDGPCSYAPRRGKRG